MNLADKVKVIAFDADDTLWSNEPLFRNAESKAAKVLKEFGDEEFISSELYKIEVKNMPDYGFGAMAFTLSMLETATKVSKGKLTAAQTLEIIEIGRELLHNPATPLEGVVETLEALKKDGRFKLILLTKGELLTQENKIKRSGLKDYFDMIEIVSDKNNDEYFSLCKRLNIKTSEFLMVGNSFKSDIAPVLDLGGYGIYIPAELLWQLEHIEEYDHEHLYRIEHISEILNIIK